MNIQDIITIIIVLGAFGYAAVSFIGLLLPRKPGKTNSCPGCNACSDKPGNLSR